MLAQVGAPALYPAGLRQLPGDNLGALGASFLEERLHAPEPLASLCQCGCQRDWRRRGSTSL